MLVQQYNNIANMKRLAQIDILRGMAALGVFIFHLAVALNFDKRVMPPVELFGRVWSHIPSIFSFGACGVSLFFVISGYCLAWRPLLTQRGRIDLRKYFLDRFARVYPPYFIAVAVSLAVCTLLGQVWTWREAIVFFSLLQGFVQEWHFGINGALSSMSTEVQFYLAFPFLMLLLRNINVFMFSLFLIVGTMLFRYYCSSAEWSTQLLGGINTGTFVMNMLPGRLLEFAMGVLLAFSWIGNPKQTGRICRLLLVPAVLLGFYARLKLGTWIADPALGLMFTVVVGSTLSMDVTEKFHYVSNFGKMSYSFFLVHVPVVVLVIAMLPLESTSIYQKFFAVACISFVITYALSAVMYHYVEVHLFEIIRRKMASKANPTQQANTEKVASISTFN